jgi:hypothetical protein
MASLDPCHQEIFLNGYLTGKLMILGRNEALFEL